jgi:hypothetical protein
MTRLVITLAASISNLISSCFYIFQGVESEVLEKNRLKCLLHELRIPGEVHVRNIQFFIHFWLTLYILDNSIGSRLFSL